MGVAPPTRVALVGAGGMAREHARAFADVPGAELAGIYSRTRARAEALARESGIAFVARSVSELYERTRADLVVVAVNELAAREVACACFEFPWTVLLEKPPGYNLADARAIHQASRKQERRVFVALNRRSYSSTRTALADLTTRDEPRHIHVQDQQSRAYACETGYPPTMVANWHYACCIHLVDYFRVFGRGAVTSVESWREPKDGDARVVISKLGFASGDSGLYEAIWSGPGPWAVAVTTPRKRWEMRPLENLAYQDAGSRQLVPVATHAWDTQFKPGFRLQAEEAIKAARGLTSSLPGLDEVLTTMELVSKIYQDETASAV